jgi:dienelactone hydrolase
MTQPAKTERTIRQRVIFVLRPVLIIAVAMLVVVPFALGVIFIRVLTTSGCSGGVDPGTFNMLFEEVSFLSSEFKTPINAYFIPGDNGVTIIVPPSYTSGRGNLMHEIAVLHKNGYGALAYESRSCMGQNISLGYAEVTEVGDALDYLATRPDVDMEKIAIHGFSVGGAIATMAGARYPELKAVSAEGGYHDFSEQLSDNVEAQWPGLGFLYEWGVHIGYRLTTGYDLSVLSPIGAIGQIAPRPILLIYGTAEPSLPGAHLQMAAAKGNAELSEVPGATHGTYQYDAPEEYERRVIGFYDRVFNIRR